jgi:ABC-type glutathione transport system ATPase component
MYAWEGPFSKRIAQIRAEERKTLTVAAYIQSLLASLVPVAPVIAGVLTFTVTVSTGRDLRASDAFTTLAMFNLMRFTLATVPRAVRMLSESRIGTQRLHDFLLLENRLQRFPKPRSPENMIELEQFDAAWCSPVRLDEEPKPASELDKGATSAVTKGANGTKATQGSPAAKRPAQPSVKKGRAASSGKREMRDVVVLHDINLQVKSGELIGICGGVGSGKSSLLSAIIGQMKLAKGHARCRTDIAYVSQQAWIQHMTLKENILFGEEYDEERYKQAVFVSCLEADLDQLPAGDETEIGERGINLSGGQKQRVSLARAIYSDKPIYLLDDPLSAVDANVGRHIFEECVRGCLRGKTILFVTHQLQYLPQCDRVLYMKDGRIAEEGSYAELVERDGGLMALLRARQVDGDDDGAYDPSGKAQGAPEPSAHSGVESSPGALPVIDESKAAVEHATTEDTTDEHEAATDEPDVEAARTLVDAIARHDTVTRKPAFGRRTNSRYASQPGRRATLRRLMDSTRASARADSSKIPKAARPSQADLSASQINTGGVVPGPSPAPTARPGGRGSLIQAEFREKGAVTFNTVLKWCRASGGYVVVLIVFILFVAAALAKNFSDIFLSEWLREGDGSGGRNISENPLVGTYALIYGMSGVLLLFLQLGRVLTYNNRVLASSTVLHNKVG